MRNTVDREITINARELKALSSEFGLSFIENKGSITVVGEKQWLVFDKQFFYNPEETQCRLMEIY